MHGYSECAEQSDAAHDVAWIGAIVLRAAVDIDVEIMVVDSHEPAPRALPRLGKPVCPPAIVDAHPATYPRSAQAAASIRRELRKGTKILPTFGVSVNTDERNHGWQARIMTAVERCVPTGSRA